MRTYENYNRCKDCAAFYQIAANSGQCRYYPPDIQPAEEYGTWPNVETDGWCMEFTPLNEVTPEAEPAPPAVERPWYRDVASFIYSVFLAGSLVLVMYVVISYIFEWLNN